MNSLQYRLAGALAAAALLGGCGGAAPKPPLEGAAIGGPFALTDQHGKTVTDRDFAGRYRLVYFGYSYCPDVCPTDLAKLGQALRMVEKADPALGQRIVPIFITVDPERDTPAVVGRFVANFHPRMVGLTGSPEAIARTAKEFGVWYQKQPPATPGGGYLVNHTAATYMMDPAGKPLALLTQDMSASDMAAEIRKWAK